MHVTIENVDDVSGRFQAFAIWSQVPEDQLVIFLGLKQ